MASSNSQMKESSESASLSELNALQDRLDELWAQYLTHLDQYQAAQSQIIKTFSNVS